VPGLAYVLAALGPERLRNIKPEWPIQLSFALLLSQTIANPKAFLDEIRPVSAHRPELLECHSTTEIFAFGIGVFYKLRMSIEAGRSISMGKGTEELAAFPEHMKLLLLCINKTHDISNKTDESISTLDATRYSWKINPAKAEQAKYVMAVSMGIIVGVFEVEAKKWLPANKSNFQDISDKHGNWEHQDDRFGFVGRSALNNVSQPYIDKRVPPKWGFRGNPIRYVNF
jgi:hypothetical protein